MLAMLGFSLILSFFLLMIATAIAVWCKGWFRRTLGGLLFVVFLLSLGDVFVIACQGILLGFLLLVWKKSSTGELYLPAALFATILAYVFVSIPALQMVREQDELRVRYAYES